MTSRDKWEFPGWKKGNRSFISLETWGTVAIWHSLILLDEAKVGLYSLCGSVGKDFVYHACGHEFEFLISHIIYDSC